tara:strand:- start:366 stop:971 length:606 start_codon:yes stop_codon:yes gene_type:complete
VRIINEALNEELFQKCKEELKSKFKERCWSSSLVTWQPQLKQGISGSCMVANVSEELGELIHEEIRAYLPEHETIRCNFHLWQPLSGIAEHNDGHRKFGATIYLNEEWPPNAGGWFIWEDEETRQSGIYKTIVPTRNMLVLNDNHEKHWVTSIAATPPDNRCSIQIWCFDKYGNIDNVDQERGNESSKLDTSLPKGEKTKT